MAYLVPAASPALLEHLGKLETQGLRVKLNISTFAYWNIWSWTSQALNVFFFFHLPQEKEVQREWEVIQVDLTQVHQELQEYKVRPEAF